MLDSPDIKSRRRQTKVILRTVRNIGQYFLKLPITSTKKFLSRTLAQRNGFYTVCHHCRGLGIEIMIKCFLLFDPESCAENSISTAVTHRFSFPRFQIFFKNTLFFHSLQIVFVKREPIFLDASLCSIGILDAPRISSSISSAATSSFNAYS